jgi:hypothetical protein
VAQAVLAQDAFANEAALLVAANGARVVHVGDQLDAPEVEALEGVG